MPTENWRHQIEALHQQVETVCAAATHPMHEAEVVQEALEVLQTSMEELRVVEEEDRVPEPCGSLRQTSPQRSARRTAASPRVSAQGGSACFSLRRLGVDTPAPPRLPLLPFTHLLQRLGLRPRQHTIQQALSATYCLSRRHVFGGQQLWV